MNIYALINPFTNEPFYVGSTHSPIRYRLLTHIQQAKCFRKTIRVRQHSIDKNNLIMQIINANEYVGIMLLYKCNDEDAVYYEKYFYDLFTKGKIILHQSKGISR